MKITDLSQEELDAMGYDDIAFMILKEANNKMKLADLFKQVCEILKLSDSEYEDKIIAFFDLLTNDKKFIMLENGYWDLRSKHSAKIVIDEDDDDEIAIDITDELEEKEEDIFYETDESDDTTDDDLKDLVVVSEEDEESID